MRHLPTPAEPNCKWVLERIFWKEKATSPVDKLLTDSWLEDRESERAKWKKAWVGEQKGKKREKTRIRRENQKSSYRRRKNGADRRPSPKRSIGWFQSSCTVVSFILFHRVCSFPLHSCRSFSFSYAGWVVDVAVLVSLLALRLNQCFASLFRKWLSQVGVGIRFVHFQLNCSTCWLFAILWSVALVLVLSSSVATKWLCNGVPLCMCVS